MKNSWLKVSIFSLALYVFGDMAIAESTKNFTIEDTIKDINPATGICAADIAEATYSKLSVINFGENEQFDFSCALSASELSVILTSNKDIVLVDTRKSLDFASFSIAGAMNATVSDIKNKSFLKSKQLILIGDGKSERDLYLACTELKKAAFKEVKLLRGGMLAWISNDYPVTGRAPELSQFGILKPLELWSESLFNENLIVIDSSQSKFQNKFGRSLLVDSSKPLDLKKVIEKKYKASKKQNISSLVVVAAANVDLNSMVRLRKDLSPIPVLYYLDSLESYELQLNQQKAVVAAKERGPKQPGCHL